ncbi:glycosyltransferase Family 34 protein [Gigaspora margarita]|uniref:Glycosyltransferase Family 34 protein n=1 Tax=Gigaspora margarita TaxID=4874 RepID=A0A8H3X136_GIGMA|nr:glycosyltransferase Family 34 protein [Gigaspora margarita]
MYISKEMKVDMIIPSEKRRYRPRTNLCIMIFMIMICLSYYKSSNYYLHESIKNGNSYDNASGHYKILLLITSQMEEYQYREFLRNILFGINDNLEPCMKYDTNIYYKFLIPPYNTSDNIYKSFVNESVKYNDMVEFQHLMDLNMNYSQEIVLNWTQSLKNSGISFDLVVLLDNHSIVNLVRLKRFISTSNISPIQLQNLVWGRFDDSFADDKFVILGNKAINTILASKDLIYKSDNQNIITLAYLYTKSKLQSPSNNWNDLLFINDNERFITYSEGLDLIPKKSIIMVRRIPLKKELNKVSIHLLIPPVSVCNPHIPPHDVTYKVSIKELFVRFYQLMKNKSDVKNEKIIKSENHPNLDKRDFFFEDRERYYYAEGGPLDYADDDDINYDKEGLFDVDFGNDFGDGR